MFSPQLKVSFLPESVESPAAVVSAAAVVPAAVPAPVPASVVVVIVDSAAGVAVGQEAAGVVVRRRVDVHVVVAEKLPRFRLLAREFHEARLVSLRRIAAVG